MKQKVVIFGSRDFDDYEYFAEKLEDIFYERDLKNIKVEIVEGGARGADRLARNFAHDNDTEYTTFPADWDKHGRSAGHIRNAEMAGYCDWGIGFWDGESKGTEGMIKQMKRLDKEVIVINV